MSNTRPRSQARALYVHFPFCETKCHYCDFYSLGRERTASSDPGKFQAALQQEARFWAQTAPEFLDSQLDTLFFGGGTPSMTPAREMESALAPLRLQQRISPRTEWTMEANPSSVTLDSLRDYRALGINRISMGVQALRDDLLARLGRVHSRQAALIALEQIFEAGFENVSVDLLCGVPGQTLKDLEEALATLADFPITHLSCYLLTLPRHHRLFPELPDENEQLDHLLLIDRWMTERGFEHYEISNYARPGLRSLHNLSYWQGDSYLGMGPSAHSFDRGMGKRWKNVSSLHRYADLLSKGQSVVEWSETLTDAQKEQEQWLLALRLTDGFPASWLTEPEQKAKAKALMSEGFLEGHPQDPQRIRLTPRGFALSDPLIAALSPRYRTKIS